MKLKRNLAISETGFLFDPGTGNSFSVNPIGHQLFELLKEEKNDDEIRNQILNEYMIDADSFDRDFYDFKKMLENHNLLDNE